MSKQQGRVARKGENIMMLSDEVIDQISEEMQAPEAAFLGDHAAEFRWDEGSHCWFIPDYIAESEEVYDVYENVCHFLRRYEPADQQP